MTMFIGLGHTSRCGKDTFANALVAELRVIGVSAKKVSFAWKLKQIAYDLYAWAGVREPEFYETKDGEAAREVRLTKLASDIFPLGPTVVDIWVAIGTPAFREAVYPLTWIKHVIHGKHPEEVVVIPDVRFPNEIHAIHATSGGQCFNVVRRGFPGRDTVADKALRGSRNWNGHVGGETVDELVRSAKYMAAAIGRGFPAVCGMGQDESEKWESVYFENLRSAGYA